MIILTQSIACYYLFGQFRDLLVTSKVRVHRVTIVTLRSDQQGDKPLQVVMVPKKQLTNDKLNDINELFGPYNDDCFNKKIIMKLLG
jgi:hypothetical protein